MSVDTEESIYWISNLLVNRRMSFDFISMINYKFVNITNRERKRDAKMNRLVKNFVRDAGEIVLYNYYHFNVSFFSLHLSFPLVSKKKKKPVTKLIPSGGFSLLSRINALSLPPPFSSSLPGNIFWLNYFTQKRAGFLSSRSLFWIIHRFVGNCFRATFNYTFVCPCSPSSPFLPISRRR